jgi:hypothetical protein
LFTAMASQGSHAGLGGGRIGGRGGRNDSVHQPVPETLAERRAHIVCSEAAKKRAVRKYTNCGVTPTTSPAPYAMKYVAGESSSRRRRRSLTPSPYSSDKAEEGCVIGPEDFVKDKAEEAHALAQTAEEADRHAVLRVVEAFQAGEAARAQRMAEATRVQALKDALDVSSGESSAEGDFPDRCLRRRQAPVSSPGAAFCIV